MPAILTIDQGNTCTKVKVLTDFGEVLHACTCQKPDIDLLAGVASRFNADCAAWSSVGHVDSRLVESLRRLLPGGLMLLTPDIHVPLTISYSTPRTLGADRVAAACGAAYLYPGKALLIADAGTALTVDFVDASGKFLGGNISAGVSLRLKALHEYTAALPVVSPEGALPPFGTDTDTALRCGAVRGVAAEINAAYALAASMDTELSLIITGGDAPLLKPLLINETISHPDLVPIGLISILKHNEYI